MICDNQLPYSDDGKLVNSLLLNGLTKDEAIIKIIEYFENEKIEKQLIIK